MEKLYKEFQNPSNKYRGKPFWSWNGLLEKDELLRQIHIMKEMGFGGYFMHSRAGLETEYLGEEWFELINACADEGEKLGMESWLYDEDRWPSGSAGGMVTKDPRYRAKFLRLSIVKSDTFKWDYKILAAFTGDIDTRDMNLKEYQRIYKDCHPDQLLKYVLVFTTEEMVKSSNYNGYTYVDTLKQEATDRFIEITYDKYKERCGDRLGRSIKGVFIDEPHRGQFMAATNNINPDPEWIIPWTEAIFEEFEKRFGYDVVNRLPEIYLKYQGSKVSQVRWHYIELLQQMFIENFVKPINDWCEENNFILTGHFLHEDSLTVQTWTAGSIMRFYEYMGYPGVDVLTEGNRNYWIVKQLSSAARQFGKKWMLSELYGCTGWQTNFESHKEIGDWQALLGINLRCHHLSWYTMQGEAKRDYPASILHQSAWWREYKYVEDYFSRIHVIMSQGTPCCETLLINPVESVWALARHGWIRGLDAGLPEIKELEERYQTLFYWLMGGNIDFDYGDEDIISRLYCIEKDNEGNPILKIGQASYKQVVVLGMVTIRSTTLRILEEFVKMGGKVIFAGEPPKYIDALPSSKAEELASKSIQVPFNKESVVKELKKDVEIKIQVTDDKSGKNIEDIYVQVRKDEYNFYVFMLNVSLNKSWDNVRISMEMDGYAEEWDCVTGKRYRIYSIQDEKIEFITSFTPNGEHIYVITKQEEDLPKRETLKEKRVLELPQSFNYQLDEPNVLVLDMAKFRIDDGKWQAEDEILKVDRKIRDHFGMEYRGGEMLQPWYAKKLGYEDKGKVDLAFEFYIDQIPSGPIELAIERPQNFKVKLNGHDVNVSKQNNNWWVDICFKRLPIKRDCLVQGRNIIELSTVYNQGIDLEAIYILGDFGVNIKGTKKIIGKLPEKLSVGNIVTQGLPFYSGKIQYKVPINYLTGSGERVYLSFDRIDGACIKVIGKSGSSKIIAWKPYEADFTDLLDNSKEITIEVILTRRNTFGPLHQIPAIAPAYGPGNFVTEGRLFTTKYMLLPAGLTTSPKIIIKE
ncbi:MAG: hypothetical protein GX054_10485 [Clostridiales bacterium]|nr:hypothetical protein [Clostridiales bacterium]